MSTPPPNRRLEPAEYGRYLASQAPPITAAQAEAAARILAAVTVDPPQMASKRTPNAK